MSKTGTIEYKVARDFSGTYWFPQKSVISYNLTSDYQVQENTAENHDAPKADDQILYPNLGSLDVWYQMSNKPKYQLAW